MGVGLGGESGLPVHAPLRRVQPKLRLRSRDLRHPLTPAEKLVWDRVGNHQLGFHIRRQHVLLGRFIADFYCACARLCIEIDGDTHTEPSQVEYDTARTACVAAQGYRVLRFTNADVKNNLPPVLEAIRQACEPPPPQPPPQLSSPPLRFGDLRP
ncbi:MAG: endonuclease domain-containing protein [Anaerolineales bacterium]|nr:endonuclease domain-containing protein [Anaerolineales bacterium]